jgi:hypothetical protein
MGHRCPSKPRDGDNVSSAIHSAQLTVSYILVTLSEF